MRAVWEWEPHHQGTLSFPSKEWWLKTVKDVKVRCVTVTTYDDRFHRWDFSSTIQNAAIQSAENEGWRLQTHTQRSLEKVCRCIQSDGIEGGQIHDLQYQEEELHRISHSPSFMVSKCKAIKHHKPLHLKIRKPLNYSTSHNYVMLPAQ